VPQRGVYVSPLKEEVLTNAKQALKVIQKGEGRLNMLMQFHGFY